MQNRKKKIAESDHKTRHRTRRDRKIAETETGGENFSKKKLHALTAPEEASENRCSSYSPDRRYRYKR